MKTRERPVLEHLDTVGGHASNGLDTCPIFGSIDQPIGVGPNARNPSRERLGLTDGRMDGWGI